MGYFDFASPKSFDTLIKMLETTDANSNVTFNNIFQKIISNDAFLQALVNTKIDSTGTCSTAKRLSGADTRSVRNTPKDYMDQGSMLLYIEFKYCKTLSLSAGSSTYVLCLTIIPWGDSSGGRPVQIAVCTVGLYACPAVSDTAWGNWKTIVTL